MSASWEQGWSRPGGLGPADPVVDSDAEAARCQPGRVVGLVGGDLCRTLGGPRPRARMGQADVPRLRVDLLEVVLDGEPAGRAAAHVVVGRWWSTQPVWFVMNAQWCGEADVAPRAHPGDGRFDLVEFRLRPRERVLARRRLRTGSHVPHPRIRSRPLSEVSLDLDRPRPVRVDGRSVGRHRQVEVRVLAGSLTVVV